jgi:hypothetical protein
LQSLCPFGILFPFLVCLDQEKSGNPAKDPYHLQIMHTAAQKTDTFYRHHLKWGQFLAGFRVRKQGDQMSS